MSSAMSSTISSTISITKSKNLSSSVMIESRDRENKYFYDSSKRQVILCHPLTHYFISLDKRGVNVEEWLTQHTVSQDTVEIENTGTFAKEDLNYYFRKYKMLKQAGYIGEFSQEKSLSRKMTPDMIESNLANLPQLTFEVTDRCNLACEYCGYGKFYCDYDQRENRDLDPAVAKRLLDHLLEYWNSPLNKSHDRKIYISFYGGEPLLNFPFIREIVEYVNNLDAKHNRFMFSMTTNAILLEKYMDYFVEHDFSILISLDGNSEHNAYRVLKNGNPGFPLILKNIKDLQDKHPEYFKRRVNFNAVLHNKNSVEETYRYINKKFGKVPSIRELNTSGITESKKEEFWKTYSNVTESLYQSEDYSLIEKDMFVNLPNIQQVMIFLHKYCDFCAGDYNELLYSATDAPKFPTGTCPPFGKKMFVTVSGKLLPCERIGHHHGLGQADKDNVYLDSKEIADRFNAYFDKMRGLCTSCHNTTSCTQCIFNLDIEAERPKCSGFMTEKENSQFLSGMITYIEQKPELYSKILKEVIVE